MSSVEFFFKEDVRGFLRRLQLAHKIPDKLKRNRAIAQLWEKETEDVQIEAARQLTLQGRKERRSKT